MRTTLLLLLAVCLLLAATGVSACWRPIAKDWDGDPDEYQTSSTHDEGGAGITSVRRPCGGLPEVRKLPEAREGGRQQARRRFSIRLSGREFLLEK